MSDLVCPICGEETRVYMGNARRDRLCGKQADMLKAGDIFLDDKGVYRNKKTSEPLLLPKKIKPVASTEPTQNKTCIICGQPSGDKPQCKTCFFESRGFMETLDKNNEVRKIRDHYYNLKERIFIIKTLEEAKKQCNRLIAIAMLARELHSDGSLMDRVYRDVESLLKGKLVPETNSAFEEERKENDETKSKVNTAQDGPLLIRIWKLE